MKVNKRIVVFDASDIHAESRFWAGLLDGEVSPDENWHSIIVNDEWVMAVQRSPNHVPPEWPSGSQQCFGVH